MYIILCTGIPTAYILTYCSNIYSAATKPFDCSFSRLCVCFFKCNFLFKYAFQHKCNHFHRAYTYLIFVLLHFVRNLFLHSQHLTFKGRVKLVFRRSGRSPLFAVSEAATPLQLRVCRLSIHLGKDTQRWHFLSAQGYKPGDLSATTRPAVNWAHFMEAAGDYLQLCFPPRLRGLLEKFISTTVFFQRLDQASLHAAVSLNKACLPATVTYKDQHMLAGGRTRGNTDCRHLN